MDAESQRQIAELTRRLEALERAKADPAAPKPGERYADWKSRTEVLADEAALRVNRADADRFLRAKGGDSFAQSNTTLDAVLAQLRRLDEGSDAGGTAGSAGEGSLGSEWGGMTQGQKIEALRNAVCALLTALNTGGSVSATCDGEGNLSGTVTFTLPNNLCGTAP